MSVTYVPPVRVGWTNRLTAPTIFMVAGDATWAGGAAVANRAFYIPFTLEHSITVSQFWWVTSTGASTTNVDVGIYSRSLARIISTGAVSRGTASAFNSQTVSATNLTRGNYYMAFSTSGTQNFVQAGALNGSRAREVGIAMQDSAHPLPATATFATFTGQIVPHFGFDTTWAAPA